MFPVSNNAKDVVDTLLNNLRDNQVEIKTNLAVNHPILMVTRSSASIQSAVYFTARASSSQRAVKVCRRRAQQAMVTDLLNRLDTPSQNSFRLKCRSLPVNLYQVQSAAGLKPSERGTQRSQKERQACHHPSDGHALHPFRCLRSRCSSLFTVRL